VLSSKSVSVYACKRSGAYSTESGSISSRVCNFRHRHAVRVACRSPHYLCSCGRHSFSRLSGARAFSSEAHFSWRHANSSGRGLAQRAWPSPFSFRESLFHISRSTAERGPAEPAQRPQLHPTRPHWGRLRAQLCTMADLGLPRVQRHPSLMAHIRAPHFRTRTEKIIWMGGPS